MLFMIAAEMERDLIRERILGGLRAAGAQGRRGGRPRPSMRIAAPKHIAASWSCGRTCEHGVLLISSG